MVMILNLDGPLKLICNAFVLKQQNKHAKKHSITNHQSSHIKVKIVIEVLAKSEINKMRIENMHKSNS